jgi:hypothetical protein
MKNSVSLALFGLAVMSAVPVHASTGTFTFTSANNTGNNYGDVLNFAPTIAGGTFFGRTNVAVGSYGTNAISTTTDIKAAAVDEYLLIAAAYDSGNDNDTFKIRDLAVTSLTATPEPATFGLIGFALAGIGLIARKRKKR